MGGLPWPPCQGEYTRCACPVQGHARHGRHAALRGGAPGPASRQRLSLCGALACVERVLPASPGRASLEELLVGKRIVGLAAIAENDVVDDVDAEQLPGVHQALGQGAIFLAGLRRP
jgi:hypothetical protein